MPITTTGRATDFITFTRTSNATVTDSNGFIKWAGHNLLTNSESFDASAWTKNAVTVAANSVAAPNGTTTADTATETAATDLHAAFQSVDLIAGGVTYTFTVFAKANTRTHAMLRIGGGSFGTGPAIRASLSGSGSVTTLAGTVASSSISLVGDGWYLISMTFASGSVAAHLPQCGPHDGGSATTYTGDITKSVYLWGAHLYRSDLGSMVLNPARGDAYYPTTPPNALGFTEDFSNAVWDKSFFGTTATSNNLIAPNGLQTADLITAINSTNDHVVYQSSGINLAASGVVTGSIYVKANTATFVRCGVVDNASGTDWAGVIVNLSTGAVTNTYTGANASNVTTYTPVSVGNGWYRIGITVTLTASANNLSLRVGPFNAASASPGNYFSVSWAAAGTESIYLWGAQLSDSASLDTYSPVYDAAVTSAAYYAPRLDFDPVTLGAKGLLVEEQRTNLLLRSAEFDSANWLKSGLAATPVVANSVTSPDGTLTADKIVESNTTAQHYVYQSATTAAAPYTVSVFAKAAERSFIYIQCDSPVVAQYFNLSTGALGNAVGTQTSTITPYGNGWYRCTMTFTGNATTPAFYIMVTSANGTTSYAGDGTSGVFLWGAQLEAGSFATSYIPTGASTATRTADVASVSTQAFPYSATEGTIVVNATGRGSAPYLYAFAGSDNSGTNSLYTYGPTTYTTEAYNGGALQTNSNSGVATGTAIKVAAGYASNNFGVSVNGASVTPDTTYSQPSIDKLRIGSSANITVIGQVYVRQITYIPRRLTNAELVARST